MNDTEPTPPPAEAPDSPGYEVGRLTAEDVPRLLELWKEQYDFHRERDPEFYVPWTDELRADIEVYLGRKTAEGDPSILVAKDETGLLGFITFGTEQDDYFDPQIKEFGVLKEVLVTESARSRGIGRSLLGAVEELFRNSGLSHVMVQYSVFNPEADEFYRKAGYMPRQTQSYKKI